MFSLPANEELDEDGNAIPPDPIDIHISKDSIALLYNAMTHPLPKYKYLQGFRSVAAHVYALSLKDQVDLFAVADRFDCDRNQGDSMAIIKYAAVTSPLDLLKRSSDANVVWPARLAIAELVYELSVDEWWDAIDNLRATWQIALTKLFWEGAFELVDRLGKARRRRLNGNAYPRTREGIMQRSKQSYNNIASDYDPLLCEFRTPVAMADGHRRSITSLVSEILVQ